MKSSIRVSLEKKEVSWLLQTQLTYSELKKLTNLLRFKNSFESLEIQKILQMTISKEERRKNISSLFEQHSTQTTENIVTYFELSALLQKELPVATALAFQFSGHLQALKRPIVAIIGSRHPTYYGREQAQKFAKSLAQANCTILSGGAIGIDSIANSVALAYGSSCAIIGSGIKNPYPASNLHLFQKLSSSQNGLILSEFPTYETAQKWHFPRRNLSIAALADFVLVIEAAQTSGSLITAHAAADFGVDVGALPGSLNNENSKGTNTLIKNGAFCIQCPEEVLELVKRPF